MKNTNFNTEEHGTPTQRYGLLPYACAQPYHPGSGSSCFVLARTHQHGISQGEKSVIHGCHCPDDTVVRMRKVLAIPHSRPQSPSFLGHVVGNHWLVTN